MVLESTEAALVLADELEERGDPRAALVRAQARGEDDRALVRAHWRDWVGELAPEQVLLRWKWGSIVEAAVRQAPKDWTTSDLVARPSAAHLERLALGPDVTSRGLEYARSLKHLLCFGPLEMKALPTVETLTMSVGGANVEQLLSLEAPRLTALHTRAFADDEVMLLRASARAPWFGGLRTWTHRLSSFDAMNALLANGPLLERQGAGLTLLCEERDLDRVNGPLVNHLPLAKAVLLPTPKQPSDREDFNGPMQTSLAPVYAPMHFRSLPPVESSSKPGVQSSDPKVTRIGSGFPMGQYDFQTCSWCGSAKTLCIYEHTSSLYSHFETTSYQTWEYECHDCGLFTQMRSAYTH